MTLSINHVTIDCAAEVVARLTALGASVLAEHAAPRLRWTIMATRRATSSA